MIKPITNVSFCGRYPRSLNVPKMLGVGESRRLNPEQIEVVANKLGISDRNEISRRIQQAQASGMYHITAGNVEDALEYNYKNKCLVPYVFDPKESPAPSGPLLALN